MSRTKGDQLFTQRVIERLHKSCKNKGVDKYRIDILPDRISLIVGEAEKTAPADDNDLDNWMAKHHAD
jgi:hypothetical protein